MISADKKIQTTSDNSISIISEGDVKIGVSAIEVMAIVQQNMAIVQQNMQILTDSARATMNDRLKDLEEKLTYKFTNGNHNAVNQFSDPDFQAALLDGQKAYARSDSDDLHGLLSDLIYQRATAETKGRQKTALNDALAKSINLSNSDLANLALVFFLKRVVKVGYRPFPALAKWLAMNIDPYLDDVDLSLDNLDYLMTFGLVTGGHHDTNLNPHPFSIYLQNVYPETINSGFTDEELTEIFLDYQPLGRAKLINFNHFDPSKFCVPISQDRVESIYGPDPKFASVGLVHKERALQKALPAGQVFDSLKEAWPNFERVAKFYEDARVGATRICPTGIAIGHAYLSQKVGFSTPLSVWLQ